MNDVQNVDFVYRVLPDPGKLVAQSGDYWNHLRVWHSRVVDERITELDYVRLQLRHLGLRFLLFLCEWIGLSPQVKTISAIADALAERIVANRTECWCQDLLLLLEFVNSRSYDAIEAVCRMLLPQDAVQIIDDAAFGSRASRLAFAMQVYYQNPSNLALIMLYEMAERSGYMRYYLVPQSDIPEIESEDAKEKIQQGFDLSTLAIDNVNQVLEELDASHGGRRHSVCTRILQESSTSTLVFIYRTLKEALIPEINRTLFGDEVETIVLRFTNGLQILEENSTKQIGGNIAGAIASHLMQASVEYMDDSTQTSSEALNSLLNSLRIGSDDRLHLVEIYLSQSPLEGSPVLMIRCDKEQTLVGTLSHLESRHLQVLNEISDVRHISVAFAVSQGKKTSHYIFKLRFDRAGQHFIVRYVGSRLSRRMCSLFEHYLLETYHINVIPAVG